MSWDQVFLSPHLDDVALSCGGQIHRYVREGQKILIVTVFAAPPTKDTPLSTLAEELHGIWNLEENVVDIRRQEDVKACSVLGADYEQWDYLDALYRHHGGHPLYPELRSLFTDTAPPDAILAKFLAEQLHDRFGDTPLAAPIGAGNHVDHQIVRRACESLGREVAFYEDYPYAKKRRVLSKALAGRRLWVPETVALEEEDKDAKVAAIACYESQVVTAWKDVRAMERDTRRFVAKRGGERLWRRKISHPLPQEAPGA